MFIKHADEYQPCHDLVLRLPNVYCVADSHRPRAAATGWVLPAHLAALIVYAVLLHPDRGSDAVKPAQLPHHMVCVGISAASVLPSVLPSV